MHYNGIFGQNMFTAGQAVINYARKIIPFKDERQTINLHHGYLSKVKNLVTLQPKSKNILHIEAPENSPQEGLIELKPSLERRNSNV